MIKNPVRTYLNWYGRNLVEISEEPAMRALTHHCKFSLQVIERVEIARSLLFLAIFSRCFMEW